MAVAVTAVLLVAGVCAAPGEEKMSTTTPTQKHTNRLINESSPYLLQHAHNPVDWYPWGQEAFERAKNEDKPIFLSVGYSTCHWCHVMEHESFEDEQISRIMNENFVCVKVDREQRPDVDEIYMNAVTLTTGSGGWPLSVFLTPEGKPFYGGTYFPPKDSYGRPGFGRVLSAIAEAWRNRRQELIDSAGKLSEFLQSTGASAHNASLSPEILRNAFNQFRDLFDPVNGGFGTAPKFPQTASLSMLLVYWRRTGQTEALHIVEKTLASMAEGGIYDHIGGGFHRYSTDAQWLVPHFEKMLYDQALLSKVYLQAYQITGKEQYARIAREIFDYVLRDTTDPAGGFYSAEDADSEGHEGTFYLWEPQQIASILNQDEARLFNAYYGVTERGNFEGNKTILSVVTSTEQLAKEFGENYGMILNTLARARGKVFEARAKRVRPHRDDKIIAAWNGLMISSLAYGGAVLQEKEYLDAASRCADFVLSTLYTDGRLRRYYRDGQVVGKAFLDDYAFMAMGLLYLYEATFETKWLVAARKLAEEMIELFADAGQGGFFLAGRDGEKLIARTKPGSDGAIPSGNSAAAFVLLRLGRLMMNEQFVSLGVKTLEAFSRQLEESPTYSSLMLESLSFHLGPVQEIVIAGDSDAADTRQMLDLIRGKFMPNTIMLLHDKNKSDPALHEVVPFVKNQTAVGGKTTAYVCENYACKRPVNDVRELNSLLGQ
jgi:uncharacterized protein YyaL (SSP411 family)